MIIGPPTGEMRRLFGHTVAAQQVAFDAIRPGVTCADVDRDDPHTGRMDDDRAPICPTCGVTMVPAALSSGPAHGAEWICLECEESGDPDEGS